MDGGGLNEFIKVDSMHINMLMNVCIYNILESGLHAAMLVTVRDICRLFERLLDHTFNPHQCPYSTYLAIF